MGQSSFAEIRGAADEVILMCAILYYQRDDIWKTIRAMQTFTVDDLVRTSTAKSATISTYVRALAAASIVVCENPKASHNIRKIYRLVKNTGTIAPNVTLKGKIKPPNTSQRIWMALKVLKRFDICELRIASETGYSTTVKYIAALVQGGYLRPVVRRLQTGQREYIFLKAMDKGPRAPLVRHDGSIYDPNTRCVVYQRRSA